jgi:hypothetical protein
LNSEKIFKVPPLVRYLCGNARIGISAQIATYQNIFNFLNRSKSCLAWAAMLLSQISLLYTLSNKQLVWSAPEKARLHHPVVAATQIQSVNKKFTGFSFSGQNQTQDVAVGKRTIIQPI